MSRAVAFIGKPKHLELRLSEGADFQRIVLEIKEKWIEGGRFFEGSECIRVVGNLRETERKELCSMLVDDFGIREVEFIGGIRSDHALVQRKKTKLGARGILPGFNFLEKTAPEKKEFTDKNTNVDFFEPLELQSEVSNIRESNTLFVAETVRNGQRVAYDGDIVVMGDANAGSELVATGCIVVMGSLRGMAHAGSAGDEKASVSAFRLSPQQLRIGAQMAIAPDGAEDMGYSEVATVSHGEIVIQPIGVSHSKREKVKRRKKL